MWYSPTIIQVVSPTTIQVVQSYYYTGGTVLLLYRWYSPTIIQVVQPYYTVIDHTWYSPATKVVPPLYAHVSRRVSW